MDMDAKPLADFVTDLADQFAYWKPEERFIEAHVGKVMKCNWKACQEAFMEAFHVITTHPQLLAGIGDENSQYDVWGNLSRAITPNATPSPHIKWDPSQQDLLEAVTMRDLDGGSGLRGDQLESGVPLPHGSQKKAWLRPVAPSGYYRPHARKNTEWIFWQCVH